MTQKERWGLLTVPLLAWYDQNRRILPWRESVSPYRTWVSEIMLQQTRVTAVLPYFERFMTALPDVATLAAVEEERLLKLWEGLGYYSRARNLQKAARTVMTEYGGSFPQNHEELCKLPGVGDYTAGAIASIAFGQPVPAVDGNVLRLVARITGDSGDIMQPAVRRTHRQTVAAAISQSRPGAYNQALMDLGATVCLPNGEPLCAGCPAKAFCLAHATGQEGVLPVRAGKKARRQEDKTVFLLWRAGRVALCKRPNTGLLAGLWEFPNQPGALSERAAAAYLAEQGIVPLGWDKQLMARHIFTHVEWHMTGYTLRVRGEGPSHWQWLDKAGFEAVALPSAFSRYREEALTLWQEED